MSFNFEEAFRKALNVMKTERDAALIKWKEKPRSPVRKARYETYQSIVDRLDSLI